MAKTKVVFKPNVGGIGQLQRSGEVQAHLMGLGRAVAGTADQLAGDPGAHNVMNTTTGRARATVGTSRAADSEATDHTLTAAVNAARR